MADSDSATRTTSSDASIIEVTVGSEDTGGGSFFIDHALLLGHSPILDLVIREYGTEIELKSDDPAVFHDWLKCLKYGPQKIKIKEHEGTVDVFAGLVEVWIFAEKWQDRRSANDIVDEIVRRHKETHAFLTATSIDAAFASTTSYSPLRRLIVDLCVLEAKPRDYERVKAAGVTEEFWFAGATELRALVAEVRDGPALWEDALGKRVSQRPACDYHLFGREGCASCSTRPQRLQKEEGWED